MNSLAITPMPYEWYFDDMRDGHLPEEMTPYKEITISFRCPDYSIHDEILKPMADFLLYSLKPFIDKE